MAQKLWEKTFNVNQLIEEFTVGKDRELDLYLAKYDVLGSLAHTQMLTKIGLLSKEDYSRIRTELQNIYQNIEQGNFTIEKGVEDIHSQVELLLTKELGDIGKKIHSGRSRNDQVLLDIKLFTRAALREVVNNIEVLVTSLLKQSEKYKEYLMPGYTHLQIAMPSSFGLWFGAYAESLTDDLTFLQAAYNMANRNPLGSAAGYGSSFPLDREYTTQLLGFEGLNYNVVYAQMSRGKLERNVCFSLASVATTLGKFAYDACLYNSQNFNFITLPNECTTGSSIMPHKKNPDVFELIRAKANKLQGLPQQITGIISNLPSGYFRDLQEVKELFIPAFKEINELLQVTNYIVERIEINKSILEDPKYDLIFSVEKVNELVLKGVPFRDAYKEIGLQIEKGEFKANKKVQHTHIGSIGNLANNEIYNLMKIRIEYFNFKKVDEAYQLLLEKK